MKLTIVLVREKHADDTIDYKINGLEHIANSQQGWGDVTLIAAPEYHFRNPSSTNVRTHHVNFHTKEHITGRMKEVGRKFPKVIFIPGTVAWKQPANEREDLVNKVAQKGPAYFARTNNEVICPLAKSASMNLQSHYPELNVVNEVLYNTAYIYSNGECMGTDKGSDFQESSVGKILVHEKGTLVRNLHVNGHDISVGVEVCLDHFYGRLASYVQANRISVPDIHVVLSSWTFNKPSFFCTRAGGVVVHASSVDRAQTQSAKYEARYLGPNHPVCVNKHTNMIVPVKPSLSLAPTAPAQEYRPHGDPTKGLVASHPTWVQPVMHNKRVMNVFQHSFGRWRSCKVTRSVGEFYTALNVSL